jgi:hypothetical protein
LAWAQAWQIKPGTSYGPISLGQSLTQAEQSLGAPIQSRPSQSDPESSLKTYAKNVLLLVNGKKKVIGITVFQNGASTPEGVGVGSPIAQVRKALGAGLPRGSGQIAYPSRGIGFAYDSAGVVERVFLFKVEAPTALQGDRLLVPGQRCGDLKVDMALSQVESAWGKAPVHQGKDHRWPDKGVGLLVDGGKVVAITVTTGDYITAKGLKMGSSRSEVQAEYGAAPEGKGENLIYPARGIAFYLAGDTVSTVQIFAPIK